MGRLAMRTPFCSVIALTLLLSACSALEPAQTPTTIQHAIHDQQLRMLMDRLDGLMHERLLTEPEREAASRQQLPALIAAAQQLAQTVDALRARLPSLSLTAAEQTRFAALAEQLRDQAHSVRMYAEQNRADHVAAVAEHMQATCAACHALFRAP